ncbi:hypothetical protein AMTRI_Chr04g187180 [Amborella trichopoda]|uniref:Probable purine permease n=1 Tax=Amborella trichopoda TaxID=13333 RepID=W1P5H8_AMBTC|nr:purine permease 1 [Amborella trichopoda]ERN02934.1 hypothetical protein AMTR_s00135p00097090 [Amborella trichopoda]|eukprot:XP_006841259.1 purine permease 1 [Amborella trichopoda]
MNNGGGPDPKKKKHQRLLLLINALCLTLGATGGPLISRLYFLHGGHKLWLSAFLETGGWPILLFPLAFSKFFNKTNKKNPQSQQQEGEERTHITLPLFLQCSFIGLLTGVDDYMYAFGLSYLPVSTSALLIASQLAFTALFALIVVRHKFTAFLTNSVVLLTLGSAFLGLGANGDRPKGLSNGRYFLGFFMTLGAAALYGLVLPLIELMYARSRQKITYMLVLEMQLVMSVFATAFCAVGMLINKDFQHIPKEARAFDLGAVGYYATLVGSGVAWQLFFIGTVGLIFCASSVVSGIMIAFLIPITEILAVIFYHEKFTGEKAMALIMSLWGFASYIYGERKAELKKKKREEEISMETRVNQV